MKSILKPSLAAVLILTALFACAKKNTDSRGLRSLGDIIVNKNQFDGSVHAGTQVLYTLKDLHENQNYTLRTEIALKSDGSSTSPDGSLKMVNIYTSADSFRNNPDAFIATAIRLPYPNDNIYEVNFAPQTPGDFVVVISGDSDSVPGIQFFYNLRLMSADSSVITAHLTSEPPISFETTTPLNPGYLNVFNGGEVASSGTFSVSLVSNATTTIANPQVFVYLDSTLTVSSLMLSSIPTATEIVTTSFNAGEPGSTSVTSINVNTNVISNVTFTSGQGPFIVLKGSAISAVTYTLTIGP